MPTYEISGADLIRSVKEGEKEESADTFWSKVFAGIHDLAFNKHKRKTYLLKLLKRKK